MTMGSVGRKVHESIHSLINYLESTEKISGLDGRCKNILRKFELYSYMIIYSYFQANH